MYDAFRVASSPQPSRRRLQCAECVECTQVFLPNVSFLGHLSGILVGLMHVKGLTKPLLPSQGERMTVVSGQAVSLKLHRIPVDKRPTQSEEICLSKAQLQKFGVKDMAR